VEESWDTNRNSTIPAYTSSSTSSVQVYDALFDEDESSTLTRPSSAILKELDRANLFIFSSIKNTAGIVIITCLLI
jgi:hypothetical protein